MKKDNKADAMNIALELVKQLITLASGVLVLSATFIPNIKSFTIISLCFLLLSWIILICSIIYGIQTISAFVQDKLNDSHDWADGKGKKYAKICRNLFIIGISIFIFFAISTTYLNSKSNIEDAKERNNVNNINNYN